MSEDDGIRDVQLEALEDAVAERSDQANEPDWRWSDTGVATMRGVAVCARVLLFCARRLHSIERLLAEQVQATRDAALPEIEVALFRAEVRWRLVHAKGLAHLYRDDDDYVLTKRVAAPMGYGAKMAMIEAMIAQASAHEKEASK